MNTRSEFYKMVAALRRRTGFSVGIVLCTEALNESNGDLDSAMSLLGAGIPSANWWATVWNEPLKMFSPRQE